MAIKRMDNVGIVVEDLDATIAFFRELGLELVGRGMVEGQWAGRVTGLGDQRVEVAMMRTPDGHSQLELSRFLAPPVVADHRSAPVNALGYLRVMFAVDDIDDTLARVATRGAEMVSSEVVQYEDAYRLCYIRGPEGLLIGLAEELQPATTDATGELERRAARAAGVAAFFQLGTLAWIRRRGLDLDDYIGYLASFTWSSLEPGIGARRLAEILAGQVAASGTFTATAAGDDIESWIDLVGPDTELLGWAGADADDLYREIERVYAPALVRLGHRIELVRASTGARIRLRPSTAGR